MSLLDTHTKEVVLKSASSSVVKIAGMFISVLVSISLGRLLGADGLGIINLGNRIINILIVFGLVGMRQVIVKEIAIANSNNDQKHINNVMYTAYCVNGGITLVMSIFLILISPYLAEEVFNEPRLTYPLILFLVGLLPQVFSRIFASGLIGYKKIWQSNLVEQTLSIAFTGIGLAILFYLDYLITINKVALLYLLGRLSVTISIGLYWRSLNQRSEKPELIIPKLFKTSLSMFFISMSGIVAANANVLILGGFADVKEVGLYTVAAKIAMLTSFFLQITNSVLSPKIAALFKKEKIDELEKMVQRITRGLFFIGVSTFVIFLLFGKQLLGVWGDEFSSGYSILLIVAVGQLVNLGTGAVGVIMIMTGFEKTQSNISVIFAILNVLLNIVLIYFYGAIGAAVATTVILIASNVAKMIYVKRLVKINPII